MTFVNTGVAVGDLAPGSMRHVRVGDHHVLLVHTRAGVSALDNACPHQGYGLATGSLTVDAGGDGVITCLWHNWKFRASDGTCIIGEENVAAHDVRTSSGTIEVAIRVDDAPTRRAALWPSLASAIRKDYRGQIARDTVRLLDAGATADEVIWHGIGTCAPLAEYGVGHEMASAADCAVLADHFAATRSEHTRTLAVVQALTGMSETTRDRPPRPTLSASGNDRSADDIVAAIEAEDVDAAMQVTVDVVAAIERGAATADSVRDAFIRAASSHHYDYGHGAIYTQKAFELIERCGWANAVALLPHLAVSLAYGTREDALPYMRKAARAIGATDLAALADAHASPAWDPLPFAGALADATEEPTAMCVDAVHDGAGIDGLLNGISLAASIRMLRHDETTEFDHQEPTGWLDVTHAMTYANAARWAWAASPGPDTARLALFAAWLVFDSGRAQRRGRVDNEHVEATMARVGRRPVDDVFDELARTALDDRSGAFIVMAHLIKVTVAARAEAIATGSRLPLAAAHRFVHGQRMERFVAATVAEAIDFVRTGTPPTR